MEQAAIRNFLQQSDWRGATFGDQLGDASARRYIRLNAGPVPALLMIWPGEPEGFAAFIAIGSHLRTMGLKTPTIYAQDADQGLMLIEDFGPNSFTHALQNDASARVLYRRAVDVLITCHRKREQMVELSLPPYDWNAFARELALFSDWFCPQFMPQKQQAGVTQSWLTAWQEAWNILAQNPAPVLVLRDYHIDNLIDLKGFESAQSVGLLDFQDARLGDPVYDLMSLLEDARIDVAPEIVTAAFEQYFTAFPDIDPETFTRRYHLWAAQRHAKVLGIFTRLWQRDQKSAYLAYLPRVLRLFTSKLSLNLPELSPVRTWVSERGGLPDFNKNIF